MSIALLFYSSINAYCVNSFSQLHYEELQKPLINVHASFYNNYFFNNLPQRSLAEIEYAYIYYSELGDNIKANQYYTLLINGTYAFKEIPINSNVHKEKLISLENDPFFSITLRF